MKRATAHFTVITASAVILAGIGFSWARPDSTGRGSLTGEAGRGKLVYERYCISCHGAEGDGQGEFAEWISPKPRDFRQGMFKWRSTPSGSLPADADLEKTLENGTYGTHMPAWYVLGHREHREVIAYLKTFSPRWTKESAQPALVLPPEPPNDAASVERGHAVYVSTGCDRCHGDRGQGDGPSARGLKDDWGYPIVPYNLTMGRIKCGETAADIYRVLFTGLSGTPMPSFEKSLTGDQAWDLAHYILSLGPRAQQHIAKKGP